MHVVTTDRRQRQPVPLGIYNETVAAGDHLALFYETDEEFAQAFGFVEMGLRDGDHCILFGIPENAAVGRKGWPAEEEFYKLEATVSAATLDLPRVAICMFDLRTQSAKTIVHAAIEGHPVTIHRNCIRENPFYVPRAAAR